MTLYRLLHEQPVSPSALNTTEWYIPELIIGEPIRYIQYYSPNKDGSTNDTNVISGAVSDVEALSGTLLMTRGRYALNTNLTISSNVNLKMDKGSRFVISAGVTLNIDGTLEAGPYQIFEGTGIVVFAAGSVEKVYPQWWGAKGNGVNDDATSFNSMNVSLTGTAGQKYFKISLPTGSYKLGSTISLGHPNQINNFVFEGNNSLLVSDISNNTSVFKIYSKEGTSGCNLHIYDLRIKGSGADKYGIEASSGCNYGNMENIKISGTGDDPVHYI